MSGLTNAVLRALYKNKGTFVSGERLAGGLGVTRAAVAKSVAALRARGLAIASNPRLGHRLVGLGDVLDADVLSVLTTRPIAFRACIGSTNPLARTLDGGGIAVAARQTDGYGRRRRAYSSEEGGAWFSYRFTPTLPPSRANLITLAAGVALCEVLGGYGLSPQLKYPNDCLLDGKKVSGMMTECLMSEDAIEYAVVGIGVNMTNPLPTELAAIATRLADHGVLPSRAELIVFVCDALDRVLASPDTVAERFSRFDFLRGKAVTLSSDAGTAEGLYDGIDPDGVMHAIVGGKRVAVTIGEVCVRAVSAEKRRDGI